MAVEANLSLDDLVADDPDVFDDLESLDLGRKRTLPVSDIVSSGKVDEYCLDLDTDIDAMDHLLVDLHQLRDQVQAEDGKTSVDRKLHALMEILDAKANLTANIRLEGEGRNPKVLVFTAFADTAEYLFTELSRRGYSRIGLVTGKLARTSYGVWSNDFRSVLCAFCPYAQLYNEFSGEGYAHQHERSPREQYAHWREWLRGPGKDQSNRFQEYFSQPIDILIATDCISEGQNLQDCDTVINYDVHWNPVRLIQRFGRIDRLGSPNEHVHCVTFWPSASLETYLELEKRVRDRIAVMKSVATEPPPNTDTGDDAQVKADLAARAFRQIQVNWDDVNDRPQTACAVAARKQAGLRELLALLASNAKEINGIPNGVFSGFKLKTGQAIKSPGMVAMIGYPAKAPGKLWHEYMDRKLIYINDAGSEILAEGPDVIDMLRAHSDAERYVPVGVDTTQRASLLPLQEALNIWIRNLDTGMEVLRNAANGGKDRTEPDQWDLVAWMVVSPVADGT